MTKNSLRRKDLMTHTTIHDKAVDGSTHQFTVHLHTPFLHAPHCACGAVPRRCWAEHMQSAAPAGFVGHGCCVRCTQGIPTLSLHTEAAGRCWKYKMRQWTTVLRVVDAMWDVHGTFQHRFSIMRQLVDAGSTNWDLGPLNHSCTIETDSQLWPENNPNQSKILG